MLAGQNALVIRGMGLYSPESVDSLSDVQNWEQPGDTHPEPRLNELRARCSEVDGSFVWVGLFEPTKDELELVGRVFELPHLLIEDAANPEQRPKFEIDGMGHGLAVLKVLDYVDSTSDVNTGQIAVFIGEWFALTVRFGQVSDLRAIRERLDDDGALRALGPVAVLYAVLDRTVDGYLSVSSEVTVDVEALESGIFSQNPSVQTTNAIYRLKRENIEVRRALHPLVTWAHEAVSERLAWVPPGLRPYFRDIGDHLLRAADTTEATDNLLMTMLMASTSLQDLQQNRDMRKISAWVAIAAVPTAMAGIYGMNFDDMPELHWSLGYPAVLTFMGVTCALLYRAFRKSGWL